MGNKRAGFSTAGIKDPAVRAALDRVAEILQTYDGVRGEPLDRVVTLRDLVGTTDLAALARRYGGVGGGLVDAIGGVGGDGGEEDTTPPPAPTNLAAAGAFSSVILSWDFSTAYSNLSHFEILRADADNYATAEVVATTAARVHADPVGLATDKYYWVRAVSRANVPGAANAVAGTQGRTADDPVAITELLTQRPWQAATFVRQYHVVAPTVPVSFGGVQAVFQAANAGVTGATEPNWAAAGAIGGTVTDNGVTWEAIEPGKAPLVIGTVNGQPVVALSTALIQDASITNAKVQSLAADKLYATSGTIASAIIGTGHILNAMIGGAIHSDNYITGSQGWLINKNGQFELNGGTIRGALHVGGTLYGVDGTFDGTLTANAVNAVNTINIAGQAVSAQASYYMASAVGGGASEVSLASAYIVLAAQGLSSVFIQGHFLVTGSGSSAYTAFTVRVRRGWGGPIVYEANMYMPKPYNSYTNQYSNLPIPVAIVVKDDPGAGGHTYYLTVQNGANSYTHRALLIQSAKSTGA